MFTKGDRVRFKDELVRERRFPPYILKIVNAYNMCGEDAYDLEDTITGEEYIAISEQMLMMIKKHVPKPDSEKISKNKKGGFKIRKSMFAGMWFIGYPIVLLAFLLIQSYWVFAFLLIPLAVGIFGAEDEMDENENDY